MNVVLVIGDWSVTGNNFSCHEAITNHQFDIIRFNNYYRIVTLKDDIKKVHAFDSLEQEAFLNLLRTAEALADGFAEVFKPFGISQTQYNVLRILRGVGPTGLACREIGARMINKDPDVTRLLDRLEKQELITRTREKEDRRVIRTIVTSAGLRLLEQLDQPVLDMHERQLAHLGKERLSQLIEILELARKNVTHDGSQQNICSEDVTEVAAMS